jgi:hypothetical protein
MTPAALHVWAIVSGLADEQRRKRLLLVLQAFIDDSGNGQPPVLVLAGFVARAESWATFADKWRAALGGLAYFKMKECASLSGEFTNWTLLLTRPYRVVERFQLASTPDFV